MNKILIAALTAMTLLGAATPGLAAPGEPAPPAPGIGGRALKDTPDKALLEAVADPATPQDLRRAVRREIDLRIEWRNRPSYGSGGYRP